MMIDFIVQEELVDNKLIIFDNTRPSTVEPGIDIDSLILTVTSDKLSSPKVFDCKQYIIDTLVDKELFTITPELLGLTSFVDGVFVFSLSTNGYSPVEYTYVFYHNILQAFEEKAVALSYNITVSQYNYVQYVNETSKDFLEEMRIVGAIIDELKNQRYITKSLSEIVLIVNDLIFKGNRVLEIINN